nr:TetR-like C-terminal domain-containing protein [Phytoactinopolyspora mesophila]
MPDTGDIAADLKHVLRATVDELTDPRFDLPTRALNTEVAHDPALAADYVERLDRPIKELKKQRLRSAQRAGEIASDVDLDVAVELLFAPLFQRWMLRSGPLTPEFADAVVATVLAGLRPRQN